ncbi:hypothetical protein SKAU_G00074020 [Synaphobranchus kaupii]|uniref:Uncharacterized protein n=1 Tax=Synaphobranchus kaupii TaxID=118154 RepID=A0A9Q1G7C0_SYNKA|nr:hypothetical protein SKAU_G00074020 [Synaphobranchus kaupii]
MVWGGISLEGRTNLDVLANGTLTAVRYRDEILRPIVRPYAGAMGPGFLLKSLPALRQLTPNSQLFIQQCALPKPPAAPQQGVTPAPVALAGHSKPAQPGLVTVQSRRPAQLLSSTHLRSLPAVRQLTPNSQLFIQQCALPKPPVAPQQGVTPAPVALAGHSKPAQPGLVTVQSRRPAQLLSSTHLPAWLLAPRAIEKFNQLARSGPEGSKYAAGPPGRW